MRNCIT